MAAGVADFAGRVIVMSMIVFGMIVMIVRRAVHMVMRVWRVRMSMRRMAVSCMGVTGM